MLKNPLEVDRFVLISIKAHYCNTFIEYILLYIYFFAFGTGQRPHWSAKLHIIVFSR